MRLERRLVLERVAPFRPLDRGQRQARVEHGVQDVDERHLGDDAAPQLGPQVGDRAHQHAAGAAALDRDPAGAACSPRATRYSAQAMKSVKLLGFSVELAVAVPAVAHLVAATDMGVGEGDAAVEEAEARGRERRVEPVAVGAVAVEQERPAARGREVVAVDDGDRHQGPVRRPAPSAGG